MVCWCITATTVINNLSKIVRWMDYNGFTCPIDIFSGEPLAQRIGYFAWDKCGHNYNEFACFTSEGQRGFTILSEIFNTCSRGIGCGMQASFGVRLSDMSHHICRRL